MSYDIILDGKMYLREIIDGAIKVEDSLDEVAMRISFRLVRTGDFSEKDIKTGMDVKVIGIPYGSTTKKELFDGIIWEIDSRRSKAGRIDVTAYDRGKYLQKSEEQWQFKAGTASDRIKKYAEAFSIPLGTIPNTSTKLAPALYRTQSIYQSIKKDLNETALKGGKMYKPRFKGTKLELYEVGSNATVYHLLDTQDEITQLRSMDNIVTKVKILGNADDKKLAPVLAVKQSKTAEFGTLQKIITKNKKDSMASAEAEAQSLLSQGIKENFTSSGIGINTIRAGDKVLLADMPEEIIVKSVTHELGSIDRMTLQMAYEHQIRREVYGG